VLEYLSPEAVSQLLKTLISGASGSLLLLIEPIYRDFDIQMETESRVLGFEHSYSHNYVHLLQNSGYELQDYEERQTPDARWIIVQAAINNVVKF